MSEEILKFKPTDFCTISRKPTRVFPGNLICLTTLLPIKIALINFDGTHSKNNLQPSDFLLIQKIFSTKEKRRTKRTFKIELLRVHDTHCVVQYIIIPYKLLWIFDKI